MKNDERKPGYSDEKEIPKNMWTINYKKCTVCCECIDACKLGILKLEDDRIKITSQGDCTWCGDCANACAPEAIVLT